MDLNDIIAVVDTEQAATLCLSKGGWEGWLQCELWRYLSIEKEETVERELRYPGSNYRCDLVVGFAAPQLWVELKAFGEFRAGDADAFLDDIAADVHKLPSKPLGAKGLAVVVVPKGIKAAFRAALSQRGWHGFQEADAMYCTIYHMAI